MSLVNTQLFYCSPAAYWEGALPIGNGRIGAMIFGGGVDALVLCLSIFYSK